jgi:hypothetical protein
MPRPSGRNVVARRERYSYDGPAFLILDNCTAHCGPRIIEMCERNGLVLLYLPVHSSHFLQCVDLSIFCLTKREISGINRMDDVNVQTSHIHQILNEFMSTVVPTNIVKSFKNSGISIRREGQQAVCHVTAGTVRLHHAEELTNPFGPAAAEQAEIESANLEL